MSKKTKSMLTIVLAYPIVFFFATLFITNVALGSFNIILSLSLSLIVGFALYLGYSVGYKQGFEDRQVP